MPEARLAREDLVEQFKALFGRPPKALSSAPGRLDLLNTHQDYKGLPVVGAAVRLRCYAALAPSGGSECVVASLNLRREGHRWIDRFDARRPGLGLVPSRWFGRYFRAAVTVLCSSGIPVPGFKVAVLSDVPVASGLSSSAALLNSVIAGATLLAGQRLSPGEIAELAYRAEHDVLGIPCGRLDQYTSAFGGVVLVRTRPPYGAERLRLDEAVFATSVTPVRHSTASIHPVRQAEIEEGLKALASQQLPERLRSKLGLRYWEPDWSSLSEEELAPYLRLVPRKPRMRILYTLRAHRSTLAALKAMRVGSIERGELVSAVGEELVERVARAAGVAGDSIPAVPAVAAVMNYQHNLLRDLYEVSVEEVEAVRGACLKAGALGSKLSGAGFGGAIVSLCGRREDAARVVRESLRLGRRYCILALKAPLDSGVEAVLL